MLLLVCALKGTGRARALPLGKALVRLGHQVALFVPPYDGPEDSGLRWSDGGVEVINVRLPGALLLSPSVLAPLGQLVLAWRLLLAVRAWHSQAVHVFQAQGPVWPGGNGALAAGGSTGGRHR